MKALKETLATSIHTPTLFLSSGGSALSLLDPSILPERPNLTMSVLDEHYVTDATNRNFEKLKNLPFFTAAKERGVTFFDVYGGTVKEAGKRFDGFLRKWMHKNRNDKIVCTVGIGTDGHTAGIVPFTDESEFSSLFAQPEKLAVGYSTSHGPFKERITSTFTLLQKCDTAILYASGKEKESTVQTLITSKLPPHLFPAMFLKTIEQATLYADKFK